MTDPVAPSGSIIRPDSIDRRTALATGLAALVAPTLARGAMPAAISERWIDVGGAELYVRDSGGNRPAVILAHPATGSALIWEALEARFGAAGFRTIAWSRRGYARSRTTAGSGADTKGADILHILDTLNIARAHALGSAAGGGVVIEFAVNHPDRVRSLVIANHLGNIADPVLQKRYDDLRPKPFNDMPASFRELGPVYRAADPEGVARWEALERISRGGGGTSAPPAPMGPPPANSLQWADLEKLPTPMLWITGDADSYAAPPLFTEHRRRLKRAEFAVIDGAGHSAYWENPDAFCGRVLEFWRYLRT